jgi:ABC-type transporter Mla subunit MlaD
MNVTSSSSTDVQPLVEQLISTLSREHTMLRALEERLTEKLEAIRRRNAERLAATTHDISHTNHQLESLAQQHTHQMKQLGQALGGSDDIHSLDGLLATCRNGNHAGLEETLNHWQARMRDQAHRTQDKCEEVTFALQYATRLGQEMLQALRGQSPEPSASNTDAYTAAGTAAATTSSSSLVNHIG